MSTSRIALGSRLAALVCAIAVIAVGATAADARVRHQTFAPKHGRIYHGVSDSGQVSEFRDFQRQVRAHPAVLQEFYHWDVSLEASGAFQRWDRAKTLGVVSLSTGLPATGGAEITPKEIAKGRGDHYLLRLNQAIATRGKPVLFRLFPEMNGSWNPYSAFSASGQPRPGHSTRWFRKAWRRIVLIVRGGHRRAINNKLHRMHMPSIQRTGRHNPVYDPIHPPRRLPRPKVSFMWVPQTTGSPNVAGNQPKAYWPGGRYVDWVGIDIYSKYAGAAFPKMREFYRRFDGFPFMIGEYSPWDNDFGGGFTRKLLGWAQHHRRTKMLIYYRSVTADNPYYISHYPGARTALRHALNKHKFAQYAPSAR